MASRTQMQAQLTDWVVQNPNGSAMVTTNATFTALYSQACPMFFTARLIRGSEIYKLWRAHNRLGGNVNGVRFSWLPGGEYVSDGGLSKAQVAALQRVSSVRIEMTSIDTLTPVPTPVDAPDPTPKPAQTLHLQQRNNQHHHHRGRR